MRAISSRNHVTSGTRPGRRMLAAVLMAVLCLWVRGDANATWAPAPSLAYYGTSNPGPEAPGDIIMNSVKVPGSPTMATYYETLGWNFGSEGGGYTGIQWTPERIVTGGPVFIFSLWDPLTSSEQIVAPYTDSGTETRRFGGEGTGLNSMNWTLGWVPDEWYTIVVRRWNCNASHTCFGHWVQKLGTGIWTHNITMDFPVANVTFNGVPAAFLEDFGINGMMRSVYFRDCWKRLLNNTWVAGNHAFFNVSDPPETIPLAYDGKTIGNTFYLQAGEGTVATIAKGTFLPPITAPAAPTLSVGQLASLTAQRLPGGASVSVAWTTNPTLSPQFAYRIRVRSAFDNAVIYDQETEIPHVRSTSVLVPAVGQFTVEMSIRDIFDHVSATLTTAVPDTGPDTAPALVGSQSRKPHGIAGSKDLLLH